LSKYTTVICYFNRSGYLLGLIGQLLPKRRKPRLIWIGFIPPPRLKGVKGWVKEQLTYRAVQGYDVVVCFTKPHLKSLEQRFPKIGSRLVYVRWWANSEDLNRFDNGAGDEGYVFCGGRTNRDFGTFLTAVGELDAPVKLVIGKEVKLPGEAPANVEIYRDISFEQFYSLMGKAAVVVIPLLESEIPSGADVLGQAMQMGRPVVATNLSGMDDYVTDGHNAFLVKPHDPIDLRHKLGLLLNESDLRARFRQAGYETVRKHNANTFAEDLAHIITHSGSLNVDELSSKDAS
jgi:glycosyltransferase involved in cell wall biosynthesis